MKELERATRTVFVSNLNIKINEKDLFILFTQKAGKVTDIYIICDKHTNKSKGLAYIELETIESMARALSLTSTEIYGQSIQVKPSEMEKNVQWTLQKQAQQGILTSASLPTAHITPLPKPGVDVAAAAAAAAAKLLSSTGANTLISSSTNYQEDQRQRKMYIGNLPREINELVLRNMFEPFGVVESSNVVKDPAGKSQGYGFILFREKEAVDQAIHAMNGMLIGTNVIKVNYVTSVSGQQTSVSEPLGVGLPPASMTGADLDRIDEDGGLRINAQNRIMLMQKLASSANIELPMAQMPTKETQSPGQAIVTPQAMQASTTYDLSTLPGLLGPPSPVPTVCLLLKNMFDPNEMVSHEDWELEVYEDVKGEASKTGAVLHVFIDKNSQGFVYIKMENLESSVQTHNMLNGRNYGGRQIIVQYQFLQTYDQVFIQ